MTNFSKLYQPIFMILFPRNLFTVCSAMLLVQLELVEYSLIFYAFCRWERCSSLEFGELLLFSPFFLGTSWRLWSVTIVIGIWCLQFVCLYLLFLWAWRTAEQCLWGYQLCNRPIWMVSISESIATNPANNCGCYTGISYFGMFWEYFMLSRCV